MKKKFFIYGVPGSGKTYFSRQLRLKIDYPLVEADTLKDLLQKNTTKEKDPFVFLGTCQAYQYFGEQTQENVIKGLQSVRVALSRAIDDKINQHEEKFVMEGAVLDPKELLKVKNGVVMLLVTEDEAQHRRQFFKHRLENEGTVDEFASARMVQKFLIKEANEHNIFVLKNAGDIKDMVKKVKSLFGKVSCL